MKRFHVHVAVDDLKQSIGFYSALFAAEPSVIKTDYAKWMLDDPRVNFAISTRGRQPGLDHLGIQAESGDEQRYLLTAAQGGRQHRRARPNGLLLRQVRKIMDRRPGRYLLGNVLHDRRKHQLWRRHG
jgi:catechol 2,3-dioxygenase-like lactoylglutathione lyase family enzyme